MTEQRKIPKDRFGNRFYEVGDLVTRDGTDVHRVVDHNGSEGHAPDGMTVVCIKAPSEPWTEVCEEEFNVCRRYDPVGEEDEGPFVPLHELLAAQRFEYDAMRDRLEKRFVLPVWNEFLDHLIDTQAAEVARQPIGKPLSRRACRRNRGRVRAARIVLERLMQQPADTTWTWPTLNLARAA